MFVSKLAAARSSFRWAVTGTPLASSFSDLRAVASWVGHWGNVVDANSLKLSTAVQNVVLPYPVLTTAAKQQKFDALTDLLKRVMIRHTKSMQIGGEEALALPVLTSETKFLEMGAAERKVHNAVHLIVRKLPVIVKARKEGCDGFRLGMQLAGLYQACSGAYDGIATYNKSVPSLTLPSDASVVKKGQTVYAIGRPREMSARYRYKITLADVVAAEKEATKIKALEEDLKELRKIEKSFHAVVFTHLPNVLERVGAMARALGIEVYEVKTGLSMKKRHESILAFQEAGLGIKPKLFVATIRAGNCGINIQSATRVYLMEPAINPAVEIQCAGRIHRLGQLRDVLVRRFCFRDTIEEKICSLHEKIADGDASVPNGMVPKEVVQSLTNRPDDPQTPPKRQSKAARMRMIRQMGYGGMMSLGGFGGGACQCGSPFCVNRGGGYGGGYSSMFGGMFGDSEGDSDDDGYGW
jgi:SWI/SNF-related matrix-associated actin-dependent regulator of chromatin subfamily A3